MQLAWTIVYVADVAASLDYFERAFGLARGMLSPDGGFGTLCTGSTTLAFCDHATARDSVGCDYVVAADSPRPLGMEIGLATEDVAAALARALAVGGTLLAQPVTKPWGQTVAYLRAPDGTLVELCTPMAA
ncbi:VOC family protein [Pseudaquabacterium rugosum]|uniref:VOC family protein n=1 Tax=Pseudaquabacterium rugosum TaxID=2984194 RepID=A0ABU9B937_9BURK